MSLTPLNLRDIFTSGTFGAICLGITIPELIEKIGKPGAERDFDVDREYRIKILFYGSYEFKFHSFYDESGEYKLAGMQNDSIRYLGAIEDGFDQQKVLLNPWFFRIGMSFEYVKEELYREGLVYSVEKKHEVLFIIFPNKAAIFFEKEKEKWICWGWSLNPGSF